MEQKFIDDKKLRSKWQTPKKPNLLGNFIVVLPNNESSSNPT